MYELNTYLHEIAVAKWEAYLDIYSASVRGIAREIPESSGIGQELLAQDTKVHEEAQGHIQWNMRVEALNSIIRDNDPMAKKFRIDNWKRLQRDFDATGKPTLSADRDRSDISIIPRALRNDPQTAKSKRETEDAQQSLNRLAYLGGIFLPFSIVAAIFSMGQNFAAGMPLFYVFWVIALPLSLGVIATIYADTIRRLTPSQLGMEENGVNNIVDNAEIPNYRRRFDGRLATNERPLGWFRAYAAIVGYR